MPRFFRLDLRNIELPQRLDAVRTFLTRVQSALKERYPIADGHAHHLRWIKKQPGDATALAFELVVQRGEGWGVRLFLGSDSHLLEELEVAALEGSRVTARAGYVAFMTAVVFALAVAGGVMLSKGAFSLRGGMYLAMAAGIPAMLVGAIVLTPMHLFMTRRLRPDLLRLGAAVEEVWTAAPIPGAELKPRTHPFVGSAILSALFAAGTAYCYARFMWGEGVSDGGLCLLGFGMVGCALMLLTGSVMAIGDLAGLTEGPGVFGSDLSSGGSLEEGALPVGDDGLPDLDAVFDGLDLTGLDLDLPL